MIFLSFFFLIELSWVGLDWVDQGDVVGESCLWLRGGLDVALESF